MGPFIRWYSDWRIVKDFGLVKKLREVNDGHWPTHILYLYKDLDYYIIYGIMRYYKNYISRPQRVIQNKLNKAMSQLYIEI